MTFIRNLLLRFLGHPVYYIEDEETLLQMGEDLGESFETIEAEYGVKLEFFSAHPVKGVGFRARIPRE